jgi:hypothetical protein
MQQQQQHIALVCSIREQYERLEVTRRLGRYAQQFFTGHRDSSVCLCQGETIAHRLNILCARWYDSCVP